MLQHYTTAIHTTVDVFCPCVLPAGGVTSEEGRGDGVDAEAFSAVAHRRVLEAEARRAALRVVGVQVEVTQFAPDGHREVQTITRAAPDSSLSFLV